MGGSAFNAILLATAFPRLPPPVYHALKARLLPKLRELYAFVSVPIEAPDKKDHGDLDLLVCTPKAPYSTHVPHEIVKRAIGAEHAIAMDGNRTSNYAVPIRRGEWQEFGNVAYEANKRELVADGEIYYQVDVHVCFDKPEWERILFFHSYGDLGMILSLVARNSGIAWGEKGLKILDPPNPPFELSDSPSEIALFLNLPLEPFYEGFKTKRDVFQWASSMRYFDSSRFQSKGIGFRRVKAERTMYAEFVEWVETTKPSSYPAYAGLTQLEKFERIRDDALVFFKKKKEFEDLAQARMDKIRLKEAFSGSRVRDWTGLGEYWKGVKIIMDEVRERLEGEQGILQFLDNHTEEEFKAVVLQVQSDLGIKACPASDLQDLKNLLEKTSLTTDVEEQVGNIGDQRSGDTLP